MASSKVFEEMLSKGQDNSLLRYSLANAYVSEDNHAYAIKHLLQALELDDQYSAAWKLLGACYVETESYAAAVTAYENGIAVADGNGDKQAAKEMNVFLKRAKKVLGQQSGE